MKNFLLIVLAILSLNIAASQPANPKAKMMEEMQKYDRESKVQQTDSNCGGTGLHPKPCSANQKCCVKTIGGRPMRDQWGRTFTHNTVACIAKEEKCVTKALK